MIDEPISLNIFRYIYQSSFEISIVGILICQMLEVIAEG